MAISQLMINLMYSMDKKRNNFSIFSSFSFSRAISIDGWINFFSLLPFYHKSTLNTWKKRTCWSSKFSCFVCVFLFALSFQSFSTIDKEISWPYYSSNGSFCRWISNVKERNNQNNWSSNSYNTSLMSDRSKLPGEKKTNE